MSAALSNATAGAHPLRPPPQRRCIDFVTRLLTVDPKARATAAQALDHPWIAEGDGGEDDGEEGAAVATDGGRRRRRSSVTVGLAQNLKAFKDRSKLKRSALLAMTFGASRGEIAELGNAFLEIDSNKDGLIDLAEFTAALATFGDGREANAKQYFEAVDMDGSGKIQYSEFVAAALSEQTASASQQLEAAFRRVELL